MMMAGASSFTRASIPVSRSTRRTSTTSSGSGSRFSDARDYGRLIVHGHTPVPTGAPELRSNRLDIDTGAVYDGQLTAVVFTATRTRPLAFLQVD
jgi:hypothetical protein